METNASRNSRPDPQKNKVSGPVVFNFRAVGPYQSDVRSPDRLPSNGNSPSIRSGGQNAQSTQALLENKKAVYKSSKGFRVILNSVDDKKTTNIKKLQSPNSSFVALTSNPVSLTQLTTVVAKPEEVIQKGSNEQLGGTLKRFTSL